MRSNEREEEEEEEETESAEKRRASFFAANQSRVVVYVVVHMGACASKQPMATKTTSSHHVFLGNDFGEEDEEDDVVKGVRNDDVDAKGGGIAFEDADEIEKEIELAKREEEAFVLVRTKDATTHTVDDDANETNFTTGGGEGGGGGGERLITFTKREEGEESFFAFQRSKEKDPAGRAFSSKEEEEEEEEERRVSVSSTSPASGATKSSAESGRSVGEHHRSVRPRRERGRGSGGQTGGMNARDEQKWRSPRARSPNNNNEGHHDYHHDYHHQQQQQQQRNRQPHQNRTARRQNSFSWLSPHPSPRQTQATTPTGQYVNANHGTKHKRISSRGSWHDGLSNFSDENGMRSFFGAPVSSGPPKKWSIGDTLGEGSYGRVNLALNGETGELFALKEVKIAGCNTRDANNKDFEDTQHDHHHHHHQTLEITKGGKHSTRSSLDGGLITPTVQDPRLRESIVQLQQEVHMLSQLTHPNIVRYIGIKRQKDILNVFMEYVPGGSIASLLHRFGPLGDSVTRVYTRQILIGLDYLHSQRVVHRDIKGANILVEKSGRIKLADFGMAKMLEFVDIERNNHAKKAIKGSAYWMAPEVIRKSEVTLGCDVWSVGCTVIEMASAKPPWCECSTQVQAMYKIASSTALPTLPENNLSADAKAFILHCLKRNVEERPDVQTLLMNPFVDDSSNEKMYRAPALKYEQHDGSYSNFPDNQSLVSSHVSLEDPSEETDLDENDEDEDQRRQIRSDDDNDDNDDDNSIYGGEDTDVDESSLHFGNNFNAYLSQSPRNNEGLTDPSILGVRRNIALKPLVVNSTRSRNEKAGSRTGSSSQQDAAGTSPNNNSNNTNS